MPFDFADEPENKTYADLRWSPEDIQSLRPSMTLEEAEDFLARNEKQLRDRLCELGHEVLETLLNMDGHPQVCFECKAKLGEIHLENCGKKGGSGHVLSEDCESDDE